MNAFVQETVEIGWTIRGDEVEAWRHLVESDLAKRDQRNLSRNGIPKTLRTRKFPRPVLEPRSPIHVVPFYRPTVA